MFDQETTVVNLKEEPYEVYIGRKGKGKDGYFGNPISLNRICQECGNVHTNKEQTLSCYEQYLIKRVNNDEEFKWRVKMLNGSKLGCFCKPRKCHGDVLVNMIKILCEE